MKIMLLTPSFKKASPVQGALVLARYLHRRGEEVILAALDSSRLAEQSLLPEIQRSGLPFYCFEMTGWSGLRYISRVCGYAKEKGVDVVISYSLRPEIVSSCLSDVVRVSAAREILREQFTFSYGRALARLLSEIRLRVLRKHDAIFVLTQAMGDHLVANGIPPSVVFRVNNFVDVSEVREVLRTGYERDGSGVHIGYFGLLNRRKRVDISLRAIGILVHNYGHKNIRFHIAGDGPARSQLIQLAGEVGLKQHAIFHGFVGTPLELMKKMNFVLLTSDAEGLPRCLMEAMALGKTCIASDIPGMSEFIRHGETGYLFPRGDTHALASLIDEVIRFERYLPSDDLYRYMLAHYDITSCGEKILEQVRRIVASKVGRSLERCEA